MDFLLIMCFWIFDTKASKDWSKIKNIQPNIKQIEIWQKHAIQETNKVVCALHKWDQIKINK